MSVVNRKCPLTANNPQSWSTPSLVGLSGSSMTEPGSPQPYNRRFRTAPTTVGGAISGYGEPPPYGGVPGRVDYFLADAAFCAGAALVGFAGSSMIAASAARRFTASMPLRHDSFDSYVSLIATTR